MSVGYFDHVLTVYNSMEHVTWKSPQDVKKCPTDIETLSLGNVVQLRRVRSFYIIVCTN